MKDKNPDMCSSGHLAPDRLATVPIGCQSALERVGWCCEPCGCGCPDVHEEDVQVEDGHTPENKKERDERPNDAERQGVDLEVVLRELCVESAD
eukprot:110177-Prorocentrum_minimum.AAC.3